MKTVVIRHPDGSVENHGEVIIDTQRVHAALCITTVVAMKDLKLDLLASVGACVEWLVNMNMGLIDSRFVGDHLYLFERVEHTLSRILVQCLSVQCDRIRSFVS